MSFFVFFTTHTFDFKLIKLKILFNFGGL